MIKKIMLKVVHNPGELLRINWAPLFKGVVMWVMHFLSPRVSVGAFFQPECKVLLRGPGRIKIGDRVRCIENNFEHVSIITLNEQACVEIGSDVLLGGVTIICEKSITIGRDCMLAQSVIMDSDFPGHFDQDAKPIKIGSHCWLAGKVGVLRGGEIGHGSLLGFGAVLSEKKIGDGYLVVGNPARAVFKLVSGNN